MASTLEIVNLAFAHLGEPTVTNITTDPKPPKVTKALAALPQAADVAMSRAPWLCCLERRTIARTPSIAGDWQYDYAFLLPAGALRGWTVLDETGALQWEWSTVITGAYSGRSLIRANSAGPIKAAFTRRTTYEILSPLLVDALGYELAQRLAGPIASDADLGARLKKDAEKAYSLAMGAECGQHSGEDPLLYSPMQNARASAL